MSNVYWKNRETVAYFDERCKELQKYSSNSEEYDSLHDLVVTDEFRGIEAEATKKFTICERELLFKIRIMASCMRQMMIAVEDAFINDLDEIEDANFNLKSIRDLSEWFREESKKYEFEYSIINKIVSKLVEDYSEFGSYTRPDFFSVESEYEDLCGYPQNDSMCYLKQVDNRFMGFLEHADAIYKNYNISFLEESLKRSLRSAIWSTQNGKKITAKIVEKHFGVGEDDYNEWNKNLVQTKMIDKSFKSDIGINVSAIPVTAAMMTADVGIAQEYFPLFQEISKFMAALGYAAGQIDKVWGAVAAALAAGDGPLPIGDLLALGIGIVVAIAIIAMAVKYMAENKEVELDDSEKNAGEKEDEKGNEEKTEETEPDDSEYATKERIENAKDIAKKVQDNNGKAPKGYKGGRTFKNIPKNPGDQKLPEGHTYREYDVNPYKPGVNRGAERIVIGDDGSVWYTNDHYHTFIPLK